MPVRPRRPVPWLLLAAGLAATVGGVALETRGVAAPRSVAGSLHLAGLALLAFGLGALRRPARHAPGAGADLLDTAIIALGGGFLVWLAVSPAAAGTALSPLGRAVAIAHPLAALLVLAAALRLSRSGGERAPSYHLLVLGALLLLMTDTAVAVQQLAGDDATGLVDLGRLGAGACWAAAALHPSLRRLSEHRARPELGLSRGRMAVLWGTALAAPLVAALQGPRGVVVHPLLPLGMALLLSGLVSLRMWGLLRVGEGLAVRQAEDRLRALVHHIDEAVLVLDDADRVLYASPAADRLWGLDGQPGRAGPGRIDLTGPVAVADRARLVGALARLRAGDGAASALPVRGHPSLGPDSHFEVLLADLRDEPGVGGAVVTVRDVSHRTVHQAQLLREALHDPLTGLPDRRMLLDEVRALLASGRGGALLFVDLDDFKGVNDRWGHDAGDALLRAIADRLRGALRRGDLAARLGGDEFAVLTAAGEADALALAGRLVDALTRPAALGGRMVDLGASVGVALTPGGGTGAAVDASTLLRQADTAMYAAKAGGGGRFERFDARLREQAVRRVGRTADLRRAIAGEQLWLAYQPLAWLGVEGGRAGYVARLTWDHESGPLGAAEFLPLAEEVGLSRGIGRWMVEAACREAVGWVGGGGGSGAMGGGGSGAMGGGGSGEPPFVAVDVPVGQVRDRLLRDVEHALAATGLPPERLVVQVPERALAGDAGEIGARLRGLATLGVRLSVSGFGSGGTSPAGLHRLPLHAVELDPALVAVVDRDEPSAALVRGVLDLARRLDLVTIAPGVERPAQRDLLTEWGCTLAHGDLIGGALPAVEVRGQQAHHPMADPVDGLALA